MAKMRHDIIFSPEANDDFRSLRAFDRAAVRDAINEHLLHEPTRQSKSRIKRLRGVRMPQFRLRVGGIRVFYDVRESDVEILGIVDKSFAAEWLEKWEGKP